MSLINDALRKAREDEAASASPDKVKVRARETSPSQGKLVALALVMGGIIIILLSVIIVAIAQLFRRPEPVVRQAVAPVQVVEESSAAVKSAESAMVAVPELPAPTESAQTVAHVESPGDPAETKASVSPEAATLSSETSESKPAVTEPESASTEAAPEPPAPKVEVPDPKIAEFVQSIQIRGVGKSKVLLLIPGSEEAAAYAEGDAIDCAYELTLVSIGSRKLLFEAPNGQKYGKPL